ncbi:MAG: hypothetical protein WA708_00220 [Acidobacteriaceae bacterium]
MRNKLVIWSILLIVGFLIGFIPQYARSHRLQQNVSAMDGQLAKCRSAEQLSQLRSTATLMYLEATQKNYGTSGNYAGRLFDQAQHLASDTQNEALRNSLREILTARDQITAGLAKGDDAVVPAMQKILAGLEQNTTQ